MDSELIVRPHTQHVDNLQLLVHGVDKAVLVVDAAGHTAPQIPHQLLVWRRILPRVLADDVKKRPYLAVQRRRLEQTLVPHGSLGKNDLIRHVNVSPFLSRVVYLTVLIRLPHAFLYLGIRLP